MLSFPFLRRRWRATPVALSPPQPFEVPCRCGAGVSGNRLSQHQVVRCRGCGQPRFVFPSSPLASVLQAPGSLAAPRTVPLGRWLLLTLAGGVAVMALLTWIVRASLAPSPASSRAPATTEQSELAQLRAQGVRELEQGHYRLGLEHLSRAVELAQRQPGLLSRSEQRQLNQLHGQSLLLAQLLHEPLEEVLLHAQRIRDDREWEAQFTDYWGKSVIFDDVVRRSQGEPVLCYYEVRSGKESARVALGDLRLLQAVPLEVPQRLLFGARLSSFRREEAGRWVIRFLPDSGVLLTDPAVVAGCYPGAVDDQLRQTLQRQQRWLDNGMKQEG